jgi:hypothetical protein
VVGGRIVFHSRASTSSKTTYQRKFAIQGAFVRVSLLVFFDISILDHSTNINIKLDRFALRVALAQNAVDNLILRRTLDEDLGRLLVLRLVDCIQQRLLLHFEARNVDVARAFMRAIDLGHDGEALSAKAMHVRHTRHAKLNGVLFWVVRSVVQVILQIFLVGGNKFDTKAMIETPISMQVVKERCDDHTRLDKARCTVELPHLVDISC